MEAPRLLENDRDMKQQTIPDHSKTAQRMQSLQHIRFDKDGRTLPGRESALLAQCRRLRSRGTRMGTFSPFFDRMQDLITQKE